jgi:hypothetical protein
MARVSKRIDDTTRNTLKRCTREQVRALVGYLRGASWKAERFGFEFCSKAIVGLIVYKALDGGFEHKVTMGIEPCGYRHT